MIRTRLKNKTINWTAGTIFLLFAFFSLAGQANAWTDLGGGDHGGANWTPSNGTYIAGVHTNIGTFTVSSGSTVYVQPYNGTNYGKLEVSATTITISGTLNATGAGYGGGGGGGGAAGNTAWKANNTSDDGKKTSAAGAGGAGAYGGSNGSSAYYNTSGLFNGYYIYGGNGGAGGGGYGYAYYNTETGGMNGSAGSAGNGLDYNNDTYARMGGGGGGGGGAGGRGGGAIVLTASGTLTVNGKVAANGGSSAGDGSAGGSNCNFTNGYTNLYSYGAGRWWDSSSYPTDANNDGGNGGGAATAGSRSGGTQGNNNCSFWTFYYKQTTKSTAGCYGAAKCGLYAVPGGTGGSGGVGGGGGIVLNGNYVNLSGGTLNAKDGSAATSNGGTLKVFYQSLTGGTYNVARSYFQSNDTTAPTMSVTPASGTTGTSISYTAYWQDSGSGLKTCAVVYRTNTDTASYQTCSGTGQKTYSGSFTTTGTYYIYLYGVDNANNEAYTGVYSYTVDTTAPTAPNITGTTPTNDTTPTWSWTSGGGGNGTYRYKLDNSTLTTGATETTSLSYTPTSALSSGNHTLYVQERDSAGNWSSSGSKTITIDTTPPKVTLTASPNPIDYGGSSTLSWTSDDAVSCWATTNNWSGYKATKGGNQIQTVSNLTDADYGIKCADSSNNSASASVTVRVKPGGGIGIDSASGATYANGTSVTLSLSCTSSSDCSKMQFSNDNLPSSWSAIQSYNYSASQAWTLSSGDGTKTVYVRFQYNTGIYSSVYSDSITLDTTAPTMSVTAKDGNGTAVANGGSATSISYAVSWQDAGSGLSSCIIYLDGAASYPSSCSGTAQVPSSGSFTDVGPHSVYLYGADVSGNFTSTGTYSYTVTDINCNPSSVDHGSVGAAPGCIITCNSGYYLSGTTCVADAPTATLYASSDLNPTPTATSIYATYNTAANLTWTSTNTTSCTGTGFDTGSATSNSTGVSTGNLYATQTYSISCTGTGGTANSSVVVHVLPVYGTCSRTSCKLQTGIEGQTYTNLCSTNCTSATSCGGSGGGGGDGSGWHSVCANNACVVVNGAGTNECSTDLNCGGSGYPASYYGVCSQGACVMVSGTPNTCEAAGVSTCSNYGGTCPNPTGSSYNLSSSNDLNLSITKQSGTTCSTNTTIVVIEPLAGFSDTVNLSVNDWGGLASYSPTSNFSRTSLTSAQYASGATLNVCAAVTAPSNNYYVTVRGTGATSGKVIDRTVKVILHNAASSTWREI
ncbi:MAG: hypothetical protein HZA37_02625 [Parcubacteria group bacterium]|nr:hypothetical protein [Parcubacteria group bacterium]